MLARQLQLRTSKKAGRHVQQYGLIRMAPLHLGRATSEGTSLFLSNANKKSDRSLMFSNNNVITFTSMGYGSPSLITKESAVLEQLKDVVLTHKNNFLQTHFWFTNDPEHDPMARCPGESIAINELINEENISRDGIVISALLDDKIEGPPLGPEEKLNPARLRAAIMRMLNILDIETLDMLLVRLPVEIFQSNAASNMSLMKTAITELEASVSTGHLQGYGLAFPSMVQSRLNTKDFESFMNSMKGLWKPGCVALQGPLNVQEHWLARPHSHMVFIGERPLDIFIRAGRAMKHLQLITIPEKLEGDVLAMKLKEAFDFALHIEIKYRDDVYQNHSSLHEVLPSPDEVAWAHILALQNEEFDNYTEWLYIQETQINPRVEAVLHKLQQNKATQDFAFAYSVAIRDLLRYFDASIEMISANQSATVHSHLKTMLSSSITSAAPLEDTALHVALSTGANCILVAHTGLDRAELIDRPPLGAAELAAVHACSWSDLS